MGRIVFSNARIFDGSGAPCADGEVLVEDGVIRDVSPVSLGAGDADVVDCGGRVLMPGMIDAHVHVYAANIGDSQGMRLGASYLAHHAARFLRDALDSGFTTVRDMGGGDRGLAFAIRDGLLPAPRLFYGGRIITQTGGHGDFRSADVAAHGLMCGCAGHGDAASAIADGADQVRAAVREELRRGASHIKVMASGGVGTPGDPIDRCQYGEDEIRAAVDEATRWGVYVAAHCHPNEAIRRCIALGVRTIEHATLIDEETAQMAVDRGAYLVPTLSVIFALAQMGPKAGLPPESMDKLAVVAERAVSGLALMHAAGAKIGFGTDLLGPLYPLRGTEFPLRAKVMKPADILRSACQVNAEILQQQGRLGCVAPGAHADLLVVDGDPTVDIEILSRGGAALPVIMQAGRFHKRTI